MGESGYTITGGTGGLGFFGLVDLSCAITRTTNQPKNMTEDATYLGPQVGLAFPIHHKLPILIRGSAGVSWRVQGADGPQGAAFTWSVGVLVPLFR